ncbi:MAG: hypothetical protein HY317_04440 [Acidobacteria bacterium]|nr:hypothetical protein [Acidobacteriota bacterium]
MLSAGASVISVDDPALELCTAKKIRLSLRATAPGGDLAPYTNFVFELAPIGPGRVVAVLDRSDAPLSGPGIGGTACGQLLFEDFGPDGNFDQATPPYVGTFAPDGALFTPDQFTALYGLPVKVPWALQYFGTAADNTALPIRVECWTLELTVGP